jgi:hypothetical protein
MATPYNVDPFEPFEVEGFVVTGMLYFLGPTPPPVDFTECCRGTVRLRATVDGKAVRFVPVFTDLDLAERFLDSRSDRGAGFNATRPRTRAELILILTALALQGEYALGVDPNGPTCPRLLPLGRFLEVLEATTP